MDIIRSFLFVPASRPSWIEKIPGVGADAVILDLEDSVPEDAKDGARGVAAAAVPRLKAAGQRVFIRINRSAWMYSFEDILAVTQEGLEGLVLPKPDGAPDVAFAASLLAEAESRRGLPIGHTILVPTLETARSVVQAAEIASHPRVGALAGAAARNGDVARSLGFQWTRDGLETLYMRSSVIAAARAAGKLPIGGLWQEVHDLAGLETWASFNRQLGFTGEMILHPSNVPVVNRAYSPLPEDVEYYRGMIKAFENANAQGRAAIVYEGEHIDLAHVTTARSIVALAATMQTP
jgi:citrate lyase subunit beta / citryl-CoA lyase